LSLSEEIALIIEEKIKKTYQEIDEKKLIIGVKKNAAAAGAGIEVLDKN
jgi:hypothetical protein